MYRQARKNLNGTRGVRTLVLAGLLLCIVCSSFSTAFAQETAPYNLDDVLWVERSSPLLRRGSTAVAVSGDEQFVYAAGRGFVVRSADGGASWKPVLLVLGSQDDGEEGEVVTIDPDDADRFAETDALTRYEELRERAFDELAEEYGEDYATTLLLDIEDELREEAFADLIDDASAASDEGSYIDRLQRLRDAGFSDEEALSLARDPLAVYDLVTDPRRTDAIYAATGVGLYRSIDFGESWQKVFVGSGEAENTILSVGVLEGGARLVLGTAKGLRLSEDGGRTWVAPAGGLSTEAVRKVVSTTASRMYVVTDSSLYRSDDEGVTWLPLATGAFNGGDVRDMISPKGWSDTLLVVTDTRVYRSDDGGATFGRLGTEGLSARRLTSILAPLDSPNSLLLLAQRGVFTSIDGGNTWQDGGSGLIGQTARDGFALGTQLWLATDVGMVTGLFGEAAALAAARAEEVYKIWKEEPSPVLVIQAAMATAEVEYINADAWMAQAKLALLGPTLDVRARWRINRLDQESVDYAVAGPVDEFLISDISDQDRRFDLRRTPESRFEYEIWLTVDLGRILFDPVEASVKRMQSTLVKERAKLGARVVKLLMQRRASQVRAAMAPPSDLSGQLRLHLDIEENTALLDALTGGFFSSALNDRRTADNRDSDSDAFASGPNTSLE